MPRAIRGVLIECDPSIKSIIVNIDSTNHDYIIEDLDDERVVVKENMVSMLKAKLEDVRPPRKTPSLMPMLLPRLVDRRVTITVLCHWNRSSDVLQRLKENLPPEEESGSE
ncbi:hypothetical protein FZEAL_6263 [Fusarium zealandicum]|uniref:General transcription and DNA repair factor IIH subunit TFB5 n=1 Tax=Fusarium zealandicum TaxID=1053134 RepID=A0A8H4UIL5_9HYPO|nr:hypothetical protein FZEAL_6263 [Fusarium zealandicum]